MHVCTYARIGRFVLLFWTRKPQPSQSEPFALLMLQRNRLSTASRPSDGDLGLAKIVFALFSATPSRSSGPGVGLGRLHQGMHQRQIQRPAWWWLSPCLVSSV